MSPTPSSVARAIVEDYGRENSIRISILRGTKSILDNQDLISALRAEEIESYQILSGRSSLHNGHLIKQIPSNLRSTSHFKGRLISDKEYSQIRDRLGGNFHNGLILAELDRDQLKDITYYPFNFNN